jgi:hypothetical protein
MSLEDAEDYFRELREEQCKAVLRYRIYSAISLGGGLTLLIGTLIWAVIKREPSDQFTDILVKVAIPFGCGLFSALFTAVPVKEITNRKEKIRTYDRLLAVIERIKTQQNKYQKDLKEILERMKAIMEAIAKGC